MSLCCISDAVNRRSTPFTVLRASPGNYDEHGRWTEGSKERITLKGTIQPLRPEEIQKLEDSRHIGEAIKIYTTNSVQNLSIVTGKQPDSIEYNGKEYEVYSVSDWVSYLKVLAVRREQ